MISNHKIQSALEEIKEISKIDLAIYTEKGKQVAATFEPEENMEFAVVSFADSMAESQMLSGCHFFKIMVDGELEYILLTKSSAEDAYYIQYIINKVGLNLADHYMTLNVLQLSLLFLKIYLLLYDSHFSLLVYSDINQKHRHCYY